MKEIYQRLGDLDVICGNWPLLMDTFNYMKMQQLNLETLVKELKEHVCEYILSISLISYLYSYLTYGHVIRAQLQRHYNYWGNITSKHLSTKSLNSLLILNQVHHDATQPCMPWPK